MADQNEIDPGIERLASRLSAASHGPDEQVVLDRVRAEVWARRSGAGDVSRPRLGRSRFLGIGAVTFPLAAAAAVLAVLLASGHNQAARPVPAARPKVTPGVIASASPLTSVAMPMSLRAIHMFTPTTGWGVAASNIDSVVVRTTDGGKSWSEARLPRQAGPRLEQFVGSEEAWVLTGGGTYRPGSQGPQTAYLNHTTDGGATWTETSSYAMEGVPADLEVTDGHVLVLTRPIDIAVSRTERLYGAADSRSWTLLNQTGGGLPACPGGELEDFALLPGGLHGFIGTGCAGKNPSILETTDGGTTWRTTNLPAPPGYAADLAKGYMPGLCTTSAPRFFAPSTLIVSAACGFTTGANPLQHPALYSSLDSGRSWSFNAVPETGDNQMISATAGFQLGLSADYTTSLYFTRDRGKTWQKVYRSTAAGRVTSVQFLTDKVGWALVEFEKMTSVLSRTDDGGYTWTAVGARLPIR
jgi:photosystem II stability/assembly factor-like uncharacterized protein